MALLWVRLDTGFGQNPKVLALAADKKWQSITLYTCGLGYSGHHGLAGFIPETALPFIHGTKKCAADLVSAGLWQPCIGGWNVNGWAEFQPDLSDAEERSKKARAAAEIRWEKERARRAAENPELPTDPDPPTLKATRSA